MVSIELALMLAIRNKEELINSISRVRFYVSHRPLLRYSSVILVDLLTAKKQSITFGILLLFFETSKQMIALFSYIRKVL